MLSSWLYLTLAVIFEVMGTTAMKISNGLTKLIPSLAILVFYIISFVFLTLALRKIDMSVAYALWCGAGIVLICIIGNYYFNEPLTFHRILFIGMIAVGSVGLTYVTK